jgi:hypothetical protein
MNLEQNMATSGIGDRIKLQGQRVEVRGGGGCLLMLGIPFLLAGSAVVVAMLLGSIEVDEDGGFIVYSIVSLFMIVMGAALTFARLRFDIDGNSRTYRRRLSILVVIKETSGSLDEFDNLTISRSTRSTTSSNNTSSTHTVYPIRLVGDGNTLDVWEPQGLTGARNQAEQIAKALGYPLIDKTGHETIVREADHLDESLRERRQRTGRGPGELPPPP